MNYIVVKLRIKNGRSTDNEILIARMEVIGYESFEEHFDGIDAYVGEKDFSEKDLELLQSELQENIPFSYEWEYLEDKNWNEKWEAAYKSIEIGTELIVRSSFHEIDKDYRYEVVIDPKMAFGTGHHETTRLMLYEMLVMDFVGKKVLDIGCGTGILSIVASKKGAKEIKAIDIDEKAYENTIINLEENRVQNVEVEKVFVDEVEGVFDIILANINRNILLQDLAKYKKRMKEGGILLLSGFYRHDVSLFEECLALLGLNKCKECVENDWTLLKVLKK